MGRRVVRLSRLDQERLDKGEITAPEEALHNDDPDPTAPRYKNPPPAGADRVNPHDRELLAELPPHFGKL